MPETERSSAEERPRPRLRVDLRRVCVLVGLGALVILALLRLAGGREALKALLAVPPAIVVLMFVVLYAAMAVRAWRWRTLLEAVGYRPGVVSLGQLLLTGYFLNTVVPARAGDVARIVLLGRRHGVSVEEATGSLVMERALDVVVNLIGAAAFAYIVLPGLVPAAVVEIYLAALLLILVVAGGLLAAPRLEEALLRLWSAPRYQAVLRLGFSFLSSVRRMASRRRQLAWALLQTVLIWGAEVALGRLALAAVGSRLGWGQLVFVVLTVDLAGAIPLLPGALGQVEVAYLSLLLLLGVAQQSAGVAILLHRSFTFWSVMLVGGLVTLLGGTLRS